MGTGSTAFNFRSTNASLFRGDSSSAKFRLSDSKAARFGRISTDCDFREYMAQKNGDTDELWRSSSTTALPEIKKGPSLPQLVKNGSGNDGSFNRSDRQSGKTLTRRASGTKSSTVLRTTAPPSMGFALR